MIYVVYVGGLTRPGQVSHLVNYGCHVLRKLVRGVLKPRHAVHHAVHFGMSGDLVQQSPKNVEQRGQVASSKVPKELALVIVVEKAEV